MAEWYWPVPSSTNITSDFGYRTQPTEGASTNHKGIDIGASYGSDIVAASAGKVISSGTATGYGQWIRIDHGNGVISIYGHMQTRLVSVGDNVTAGQVIAEVGSEGVSTGPHLHFQIEVNGVAVDPLNYVSSDGPTVVSSNYDSSTSSMYSDLDVSGSYFGVVEAGGTTIGQRVSGVTKQPVHAFLNIYVGDNQLLLATTPARPNVIQSFEYTRLEGAGEEAIFTVFDDNWYEIEEALVANFNNIYIEYGYYGTGVKSKLIRHQIVDYSISFESTGVILSFNTVTQGVKDNLKPVSLSLNTFNPTEAVKKICTSLGYRVLDENFDASKDIHADNPFNLVEEFPITYITQVIVPQAAQENEEIFIFSLDSDNTAYFKRSSYAKLNNTKTDTLRTYIYQKGYDSSVIDFSVNMNGMFGGSTTLNIATGYRASVFGTKDKSQNSIDLNTSSVITEATGEVTHTSSEQSIPAVDSAGYSDNQMKNILYYKLKHTMPYEATLTIVGDPTIDYINDRFIRVINVTDDGFLHHTSGVYWIKGVTDSIQGGEMTTTLKLVKNAAAGDIHGVEIINPKYYIK